MIMQDKLKQLIQELSDSKQSIVNRTIDYSMKLILAQMQHNEEHNGQHKKHMSPSEYVDQFQTIHLRFGRQTGHTSLAIFIYKNFKNVLLIQPPSMASHTRNNHSRNINVLTKSTLEADIRDRKRGRNTNTDIDFIVFDDCYGQFTHEDVFRINHEYAQYLKGAIIWLGKK